MLKNFILLFVLLVSSFSASSAPRISAKIIGGTTANTNAWPWMTALAYPDSVSNDLFCGGSLIAKDWILTAAHCMFNENNQQQFPENFIAIIDTLNINNGGENHLISEIHIHPAFNKSDLTNDIALIKLNSPSSVKPIEILPANSDQAQAGESAIALGWGNVSTTRNIYPDTLQQVTLPIVSNGICADAMNGILDTMLCAGRSSGGIDTCDGDSGGPLVIMDAESQSWRQAGITSFGESKCAARNFYGVYTRANSYNDFISDTICTLEQKPIAPSLKLDRNNTLVTASWNQTHNSAHYRLNYAFYPYFLGDPIYSFEMHQETNISVNLPSGSAFYVAITAHNGNCKSNYSNIEYFIVP